MVSKFFELPPESDEPTFEFLQEFKNAVNSMREFPQASCEVGSRYSEFPREFKGCDLGLRRICETFANFLNPILSQKLYPRPSALGYNFLGTASDGVAFGV